MTGFVVVVVVMVPATAVIFEMVDGTTADYWVSPDASAVLQSEMAGFVHP